MVKEMGKKGISVKDEPGLSVVRLFGPGVGDEKVCTELYSYEDTGTENRAQVQQ